MIIENNKKVHKIRNVHRMVYDKDLDELTIYFGVNETLYVSLSNSIIFFDYGESEWKEFVLRHCSSKVDFVDVTEEDLPF